MPLGAWVLVSAAAMSLTALFIATRRSRFWKRSFLWSATILAGLTSAAVTLCVAYLLTSGAVWVVQTVSRSIRIRETTPQARMPEAMTPGASKPTPTRMDRFWGIPLDATRSDILFAKGEPDTAKGRFSFYRGKDISGRIGGAYLIAYEGDSVHWVLAYGWKTFPHPKPRLFGIGLGSTAEGMLATMGEPTCVTESKDHLRRIYSYDVHQVFFELEQAKVKALGIYNPKYGPPELK